MSYSVSTLHWSAMQLYRQVSACLLVGLYICTDCYLPWLGSFMVGDIKIRQDNKKLSKI
jgi:hypothetical protein